MSIHDKEIIKHDLNDWNFKHSKGVNKQILKLFFSTSYVPPGKRGIPGPK